MIKKQENKIWIALWILGVVLLGIVAWNPYIQYDESYTLSLIRHNPTELIRITGVDVHPPFYYLLVKLFILPFGSPVWAVRAFNVLPLAGMLLLGQTWVSRLWDKQAGIWFGLLSILLPANMSYLLPEMRMYGLASFLVTLTFVCGRILQEKQFTIVREKTAWIVFWLAGILAAYTQYYALIGVALIYVWFGLDCLKKRDGSLVRWVFCAVASAVAYLPWLFVLLKQFGTVSEDYWIPPISLHNVLSYLLFPLYSSMPVYAGLLLGAVIGLMFLATLLKWWRKQSDRAVLGQEILVQQSEGTKRRGQEKARFIAALGNGMFVYLGVITIGVLVSVLISPVFSVRYVKCLLGILVWCLAILFARLGKKKQLLLGMTFGVFALCNLFTIVKKNVHNCQTYQWMMDYATEHFDENTVLAYEQDGHYMGIFSYWFPQYPGILPDEYWQDEYEAFAPNLMTRSAYEREHGSLCERDIWTIDIGNFWWWETWDGDNWTKLEHTEPFVFYDQTDELQCDLAHFAGSESE